MKRFNFVIALLPLVLVTGCITSAIREKQAQACSSLTTLSRAIALLRSPADSFTVGALKQAEERVSAAFKDFKESAKNEPEVKIDELEKAYEDLDKEVKNIPDQSTMAQAIASISDNVTTVESTVIKTKAGLRCR